MSVTLLNEPDTSAIIAIAYLLLAETFASAFKNQVRNLAKAHVAIIQAVFERI